MWGLDDSFLLWLRARQLELYWLANRGIAGVLDWLAPYGHTSADLSAKWGRDLGPERAFRVKDLASYAFGDLLKIYEGGAWKVSTLDFFLAFMWRYSVPSCEVGAAMLDVYMNMYMLCGIGESDSNTLDVYGALCAAAGRPGAPRPTESAPARPVSMSDNTYYRT